MVSPNTARMPRTEASASQRLPWSPLKPGVELNSDRLFTRDGWWIASS